MADTKISALPAVTALTIADEFALNVAGVSKKIAAASMPGFELDYAQITSSVSVTGTSAATATTCITGNAVTYDGSTRICIEVYCPAVQTGTSSGSIIEVLIYDGSSQVGIVGEVARGTGSSDNCTLCARIYLTPSAAAHTYSVRAYRGTANGTFQAGAGGNDTYMPAYLRITKA